MTERSIEQEVRELALEISDGPDEVAELGAEIARRYQERRAIVLGMLNVDAMVAGDDREVDEQHPRLVALREDLRARLRNLVDWARRTGRI